MGVVPGVLAGGERAAPVRPVPAADLAAAYEAYPELWTLAVLRDRGWRFVPVAADGEPVAIDGFRPHPGGFTDAVRVRTAVDVTAVRTDARHRPVWTYTAGLADVVAAIAALPAPPSATGLAADPPDPPTVHTGPEGPSAERQSESSARSRRTASEFDRGGGRGAAAVSSVRAPVVSE